MDWTVCAAIEGMPRKLSGPPLIRQSRVRPEDMISNQHRGFEWLADCFDLPLNTVRIVLNFPRQNGIQGSTC